MTLERTDSTKILLFEIFYIGPSNTLVVERFCSAGADIEIDGNTYTSDTQLSATLPERTGILEEADVKVRLSNRWGTIQANASGRAFAPMRGRLIEAVIDPQQVPLNDVSLVFLAQGRLNALEENPSGKPGSCEFTLKTSKNDTEYPLDNLALNTCRNTFGAFKTCGFDREAAAASGLLTAIDGTTVTITGLPTVDLGWWEGGHVRFSGVSVSVRAWESGTSFVLSQLPPQLWVDLLTAGSLSVQVLPGCQRTTAACRRRGREEAFRPLGLFIPFHHPLFEKPL